MEHFICKTHVYSGTGAADRLGQLGIRRLLVVADPYFVENGQARQLAALAGAAETDYFAEIRPDPPVELAARGAARMKGFGPDAVLALGGGSAMDTAKAMRYFARSEARLIAVPTTSGSGAEVTDFAVLSHKGVKYPLVDASLQPEVAILDDRLLGQLPPRLVAEGGFDLLSHALEALVATGAGPVSDALAREAFCNAWPLLEQSYKGDPSVRMAIHSAATMAALAFSQAGLGVCHGIAHALGGAFHVPHGRLNAILLPAVLGCNTAAADRYGNLARRVGLASGRGPGAVRSLQNGLIRLRRSLHLPDTLAQAGIDPQKLRAQLPQITAAALADPCTGTNPVPVDENMVRRILRETAGSRQNQEAL